jgi:hypothetical protein
MEAWKRQQNRHAQAWGMVGFSDDPPLRPEFTRAAKLARSYVDGKPSFYMDALVYRAKQTFTSSMTLTALGAVVTAVGSIFWLRIVLSKQSIDNGGEIPNGLPDYITSAINAVQIQIMNFVYTILARKLTDFENHAAVTAYDDSLTVKLAVFQSINSYFGLVYIAIIKNNMNFGGLHQQCKSNADGEPDCMGEMQSQLAILMLTKLIVGMLNQFLLPLIVRVLSPACRSCTSRITIDLREKYERVEAAKRASHFEQEAENSTYTYFDDCTYTLLHAFLYQRMYCCLVHVGACACACMGG